MKTDYSKFLDSSANDREYKYKFLVYPNITYAQDLEKDSYVIVIKNAIESINALRSDIHFTMIVPTIIQSMANIENVDQILYSMPTYPNAMRTHFDYDKIFDLINWKENDYDVLYSHLPEHTAQLANLFYNTTNINPAIVGYCHWYEIKENTSYNKNMFLANIAGTLEMQECGVNSKWLKELIIKRASQHFSGVTITKLDEILQPHYLGIDEIYTGPRKVIKNSILFNHRANEYTGWDWFIETLDALYEKRQDFKLYTTMADIKRPYAEKVVLNGRAEYLQFVRKMQIGVCCFEKYSAWSISTTDGLSQGVPYLMPDSLCYPEMVEDYPMHYSGREDFAEKLNQIFDGSEIVDTTHEWLKPRIEDFLWKNRVGKWFNEWKFLEELPKVQRTESYEKIVAIIKKEGIVSKKQILDKMGWGVRISFTNYRNLLRDEPGIKFTKDKYEYIGE